MTPFEVFDVTAYGAAGDGSLDSDIVVECGPGNTAAGHVMLNLANGTGTLTFSGWKTGVACSTANCFIGFCRLRLSI